MIITRQDPFSFRLQTGETIVNFQAEKSTLELKIGAKHLSMETPGEYEMGGIAIEGALNNGHIFYTIHWDDLIIGLGNPIGYARGGTSGAGATYDILLLLTAKPSETAKALVNTDARILIPFGEEKTVASFLKELDESPDEMDKLTIKKKDIPPEGERKIIVLKPLKR